MASRALQAQMAGVEVAGQNLANVNTPGYSRQRVILQSDPSVQTGIGPEGTGVSVLRIEQVVDQLLNNQIQNQNSVTSNWSAQQSALETAQTALGEFLNSTASTTAANGSSTNSSLSDQLSSFFQSLQALAATPASIPARQKVIGEAQNLAATFQQVDTRLTNLRQDLDASLTIQVESANQLLQNIADLNDQIANAENASNGVANDLRDLRQQKLESLAQLVNFQTTTGTDGSVNIQVAGGLSLVTGNQVTDTLRTADPGGTGQLRVFTVTSNNLLTPLTGGSINGTMVVRDGTLATLQTNLNTLATNLITQVNAVHSTGYGLTNSNTTTFFDGTDAASIRVNTALADDPSLLQASSTSGTAKDNVVALALGQLATTAQAALGNQTFSAAYTRSVTALGNAMKNASDQVANQTTVASMLASQRSSVSGVNMDEEMTNLLTFQRAYQASSRVVTSVDEMIQTILNMGA